MRFSQCVACLIAGASPAFVTAAVTLAAAAPGGAPIPIRDRVFFERAPVAPRLPPLLVSGRDTARIVPLPPEDAHDGTTAGAGSRRGGVMAFASLGPSLSTEKLRARGEPSALPWAPTPAVPRLLTKPTPGDDAADTKLPLLED